VRDLLEAQDAQLRARNSFAAALVDYHVTRLQLMRDLGVLRVDEDKFWLADYAASLRPRDPTTTSGPAGQVAGPLPVVTPEQLFNNE
jgi:hypothetical protein